MDPKKTAKKFFKDKGGILFSVLLCLFLGGVYGFDAIFYEEEFTIKAIIPSLAFLALGIKSWEQYTLQKLYERGLIKLDDSLL